MYAGKVLCAQSSLVIVYADRPTTNTLRSCYVVIIETNILLFVIHLVLILVVKPVGWSIKFKLRVILLAVADHENQQVSQGRGVNSAHFLSLAS